MIKWTYLILVEQVNVVSSAAGGVPGSSNTGTAEGETPIGVLPPSSSLGAFGAVPETAQTPQAMSSFIAKVQEMTKLPITATTAAPPPPSAIVGGSGAPPPAPVEPAVAQGQPQVWSLTQFYSVDISKSMIDVKKCVFNKHTIKVCVICC